MSFPIHPLADRILVRRDPPAEKAGSLFLPQGGVRALERRSLDGNPATVLAVGPGGWREGLVTDPITKKQRRKLFWRPTTLKPGDRVLLGFHPGVAAPDPTRQGEYVHFIRESEINGKLEE